VENQNPESASPSKPRLVQRSNRRYDLLVGDVVIGHITRIASKMWRAFYTFGGVGAGAEGVQAVGDASTPGRTKRHLLAAWQKDQENAVARREGGVYLEVGAKGRLKPIPRDRIIATGPHMRQEGGRCGS
jgi:hypothetical protein